MTPTEAFLLIIGNRDFSSTGLGGDFISSQSFLSALDKITESVEEITKRADREEILYRGEEEALFGPKEYYVCLGESYIKITEQTLVTSPDRVVKKELEASERLVIFETSVLDSI